MLRKLIDRFLNHRRQKTVERIHQACASGDTSSVQKLVATKLDAKAESPRTLLTHYAERNDLAGLSQLLQAGLRPDVLMDDVHTILHKMDGFSDLVIDLLLNFTKDVDVRDSYGGTPLIRASQITYQSGFATITPASDDSVAWHVAHRLRLIPKLVEKGADLDAQSDRGVTALMAAVADPEIVRLLLETGAIVNLQDHEGGTALHHCMKFGSREGQRVSSAVVLMQAGARPDIVDSEGNTALDLARKHRGLNMVSLLESYGAAMKAKTVIQEEDGMALGALRPL